MGCLFTKHPMLPSQRKYAKQCLKHHNKLRALHGSPKLKLSNQMCDYAESWVQFMAAKKEVVKTQGPYGESVFQGYPEYGGMGGCGRDCVEIWYEELEWYDYNSGITSQQTQHFTQLVWSSCNKIGVGYALSNDRKIYVFVCYQPPGNINGEFLNNVPRAKNEGFDFHHFK